MKIINVEGIVIKKRNIGEADLLITLFTKENGKADIYIYGIRKSNKREKASVELMSVSEYVIYEKNSRYVANSFTIKNYFHKISGNYLKLQISYYLLHIIDRIYEYNSEDADFYDKVIKSFTYINSLKSGEEKKLYYLVLYLLRSIIAEQGFYGGDLIISENIGNGRESMRENAEMLFRKSYKEILSEDVYEVNELTSMIIYLESYINYNLNINLNFKYFV